MGGDRDVRQPGGDGADAAGPGDRRDGCRRCDPRNPNGGTMTGTIVVGVDGSPGSLAALRWARDEAARRGATVRAIHVWHYPYVPDVTAMTAYADVRDALEEAAREALDAGARTFEPVPDGVTLER